MRLHARQVPVGPNPSHSRQRHLCGLHCCHFHHCLVKQQPIDSYLPKRPLKCQTNHWRFPGPSFDPSGSIEKFQHPTLTHKNDQSFRHCHHFWPCQCPERNHPPTWPLNYQTNRWWLLHPSPDPSGSNEKFHKPMQTLQYAPIWHPLHCYTEDPPPHCHWRKCQSSIQSNCFSIPLPNTGPIWIISHYSSQKCKCDQHTYRYHYSSTH